MIYKSKLPKIAKEINESCEVSKDAKEYIDMKTEEFIRNLLKYSLENMVSQKRTRLQKAHIQEVIDKISLILKIYPKATDEVKN